MLHSAKKKDSVLKPAAPEFICIIAAGATVMVEFAAEVPGAYLLADHNLTRSIDKSTLTELIIEGVGQP